MEKYEVTHRLSTAYHPQTSGRVEVTNRGLKRILERTVGENHASWSDKLEDALWTFRTAFKTSIGCTLYRLLQLNELNELRDQAYENSLIYKERTKKLHDDKIKNRIFNVGDQVLLFNSRLKIFSDSSTIMEETHHHWRFQTLPLSLRTTEYRDRVEPTTRIISQRLKTSCVGYCLGFQDLLKKVNDNVQLRTLIDGKKVVVSEAIIRRDLHLDNVDRVECFSNAEIFEELARMGYEKPPPKLTFYKADFTPEEESKEARKEKEVKVFRVKKVEKGWGKIAAIDADEGITLVDVETDEEVVSMDVESQERLNQEDGNAASKGVSAVSVPELVSAAEPTVFDDEDVIITMAQTLIKMKEEKSNLLDEQIAQKLHEEEVQKAAAREKQERADMERALELQRQYDEKEDNIDWSAISEQVQEIHLDSIKKYQNLKKKPVSIAQARKNMIIYLKNMAGFKLEFFIGMTYDKVRPIFKREYKKVQTLFKPHKDVQKTKKKRVTDETLLQESFKKLRAAEVSGSEST
nr:putative nucleotidyltransferase, ribonuclease H [Tanacetum cinerariifolium]